MNVFYNYSEIFLIVPLTLDMLNKKTVVQTLGNLALVKTPKEYDFV